MDRDDVLEDILNDPVLQPPPPPKKVPGMEEKERKTFLEIGQTLGNRWEIRRKLGSGGFGDVYMAYDRELKLLVAIKVEILTQGSLKKEVEVLKEMNGTEYVPRFYAHGTTKDFAFVIMGLLGKSLSDLRKDQKPQPKFSRKTSFLATLHCLRAIRDLHNHGFIHRDVKPSNFMTGAPQNQTRKKIHILDFGLARRYLENGNVMPPRVGQGNKFIGTVRYGSLTAHEGKDLGRTEDIMCLFYALVEMLMGRLPWKNIHDPNEVMAKKKARGIRNLCYGLPIQVREFGYTLR